MRYTEILQILGVILVMSANEACHLHVLTLSSVMRTKKIVELLSLFKMVIQRLIQAIALNRLIVLVISTC